MNIIKSITDWLLDLAEAVGKRKTSAKFGCKSAYGSEINKPSSVQEAIRYRKRAKEAELKLADATDALRKIECLADAETDSALIVIIHTIAQDGYGAATNNNS